MKKFNLNIILSALMMVGLVTSCSKIDDFDDLNINPGGSIEPIPSGLLTQVISQMGEDFVFDAGTGNSVSTLGGLYCQFYSETQYTEASRYAKQQVNFDKYYAGIRFQLVTDGPIYTYANLYDLQAIIDYCNNPATSVQALNYGSISNQIAVARILKAYIFWFVTDNYGEIPYFSALKGDFGINEYNAQSDIYNDLFKELTESVAQMDDGGGPTGDVMFHGDMTMWKKFANSTRALMALRLSKVDAGRGNSEFNNALSADGGVFESGENAELMYPGGYFANPVYNYYNVILRDDYAVSQTLMDQLENTGDARINAYGSSDVGFPYGLTRDDAVAFANSNTNYARIFDWKSTAATKSMPIITSAQVYLARAEAASLGWTSEDVNTMYTTGLQESWNYWGVYDEASFNAFLAGSDVALTGSNDMEKIAIQQWVTYYPNGSQGFANWRRTGYPQLDPASGQSQIPTRIAYGINEESYNPTNEGQAAQKYIGPDGPNSQFAKVWWDQ